MARVNGRLVTDHSTRELIFLSDKLDEQSADALNSGEALHPNFAAIRSAVRAALLQRSFNDVPQAILDKFGYPDLGGFAHD